MGGVESILPRFRVRGNPRRLEIFHGTQKTFSFRNYGGRWIFYLFWDAYFRDLFIHSTILTRIHLAWNREFVDRNLEKSTGIAKLS